MIGSDTAPNNTDNNNNRISDNASIRFTKRMRWTITKTHNKYESKNENERLKKKIEATKARNGYSAFFIVWFLQCSSLFGLSFPCSMYSHIVVAFVVILVAMVPLLLLLLMCRLLVSYLLLLLEQTKTSTIQYNNTKYHFTFAYDAQNFQWICFFPSFLSSYLAARCASSYAIPNRTDTRKWNKMRIKWRMKKIKKNNNMNM